MTVIRPYASTPLSLILLRFVAAVLYGIGYGTARTLHGLWYAAAWSCTAVNLGWRTGRSNATRRPSRAMQARNMP